MTLRQVRGSVSATCRRLTLAWEGRSIARCPTRAAFWPAGWKSQVEAFRPRLVRRARPPEGGADTKVVMVVKDHPEFELKVIESLETYLSLTVWKT